MQLTGILCPPLVYQDNYITIKFSYNTIQYIVLLYVLLGVCVCMDSC